MTEYAPNKLAKLKRVNDLLRNNCERAWDVEPDATLDESRLRLHSRFCSFVTEMICKPIKTGCTIYCVNFSKSAYLYTWEWYTGSTHDRPQGQPTDQEPIEEDNEQHTGYVLPLCLRLIGKAFDGTFCTVYTDKAFTTIKLARALASRGIGLVGMVRAARPKSMPRGAQHYWPFRAYATSERDSLGARGLARRAYCELPKAHGRSWQLAAETWLDSRFVTLLSTAWFSATAMTVKRWTAAVQAKVELPCSRQLLRYCKAALALTLALISALALALALVLAPAPAPALALALARCSAASTASTSSSSPRTWAWAAASSASSQLASVETVWPALCPQRPEAPA